MNLTKKKDFFISSENLNQIIEFKRENFFTLNTNLKYFYSSHKTFKLKKSTFTQLLKMIKNN